ncbi:MAG: Phosphate transport system permease protein PstC 1 [Verrucomicrobia subdivision 3 bacterium]|nr:Phosphate transport system permease protein PstC 1 [Limisphaerales bacterium]MCS1414743.1 Phosphate transport system permease protein PstC 1 [Limisphaerales bacterium]
MNQPNSTGDWNSLTRKRQIQPADWIAEKNIFAVSLSPIIVVFLIFLFITREALPILVGTAKDQMTVEEPIPVDQIDNMAPQKLQAYLGLTSQEFDEMDRETLILLMEVKLEEFAEAPQDKDAKLDTTHWRYLLFPYQWTGYETPQYIWQPVSQIQKYNIIPLAIGSLKTSLVALIFSVPIAIGAAIYVSQLASPGIREWVKPLIEMLAGIPSVVLGFFALIVMATTLQSLFGYPSRLNTLVAGIALGLAVIPIIFSIAEDALSSVPQSFRHAAFALGSSKWQAAYSIVLPAALPGIFAAVMLGFGRAIGETMIVLMATGNASIVSWNIFDSTRTITATIAAELAETVFGSQHYRVLFMLGTILFAVTFVANLVGDIILHRLKRRLNVKPL